MPTTSLNVMGTENEPANIQRLTHAHDPVTHGIDHGIVSSTINSDDFEYSYQYCVAKEPTLSFFMFLILENILLSFFHRLYYFP